MCLNPKEIINNSKYIDIKSPWNLKNIIPCGECAECNFIMQNNWILRTQNQFKETISHGGYVIFDTLTYDENKCPWTKNLIKEKYNVIIPETLNFRCFNYSDVQKFFKRLRKHVPNESIKYYLAAEYGSNNTNRPHYHIMLYVKDYTIDPVKMSKYINKSWQNGRTDGVEYRGNLYFQSNSLFNDLNQSNRIAQIYLQKYLTKDSQIEKFIKNKVNSIVRYMYKFDRNFYKTYSGKLQIQSVKRNFNQFRKISKGYGESYLKEINVNDYINNGYVLIDDNKKIKRTITLPDYYIRKLFKYYDKEKKCWFDNEYGIELKKKNIMRQYEKKVDDTKMILLDIKEKDINLHNDLINILGKRDIKDYVTYCLTIKDKVYDRQNYPSNISDYVSSISYPRHLVRNIASRKDLETYEKPFILLPSKICNDYNMLSYDNYLHDVVLNEDISDKYIGFEYIYSQIFRYKKFAAAKKQSAYDLRKKLDYIFKEKR